MNKKHLKILYILVIIIILILIIIKYNESTNPTDMVPPVTTGNLEIPILNNSDQIVKHTAYTFQYSELNEQPDWVAYYLTKNRLRGNAQRTDDFKEDPLVVSGSAQLSDYKRTGYDRGHMAPAADFSWSQTAMSECFYLSNMSPQLHSFNAGIWETLENQVRIWADSDNDTLFIVTGPILKDGLPTVGARNKLTVPDYFYKALLRKSATGFSAIAFVLKHENSFQSLYNYAITIDSLEKLTKINFFYKLPSTIQAEIESKIDFDQWPGITAHTGSLKKRLSKY
jgi:endonuclease G